MTRSLRLLAVAVALGLLAGCSRVQLAYNQLDWLIPYYVGDYIQLDDRQSSYLDTEVNRLLQWHCGTQLDTYAELLRDANRDFQNHAMDKERLGRMLDEIEGYWKAIKRRASPAIAQLFLSSSQGRLDEFLAGLAEGNREWLEEFQDQPETELREDYRDNMSDELERWFGPLTPAQQQRVTQWSRDFTPLGLTGLEARKRWQGRLAAQLAVRSDDPAFFAAIQELFVNPDAGQPAPYLEALARNRDITLDMLVELSGRLTDGQLEHLEGMAASLAADFEHMACRYDPTA